ncbi:MAG TPA: hypothetical protein VFC19_18050 [Candidatus Limnocylindrales bacterium]|nr:hypothetical protein [Candidatus Limnocylindrales bacterium]
MTDPVADVARAAAARLGDSFGAELGDSFGAELAEEVETELEHEAGVPRAYADPVSVAGLIVAIASLAWNIYVELRRSRPELAGAVRERWAQDHAVDATASAIIDVVAEETVKRGER